MPDRPTLTRDHIQEAIDVLGSVVFGDERVTVYKERLRHLRRIEQLALDFHDRLLDVESLRRALEDEFQG